MCCVDVLGQGGDLFGGEGLVGGSTAALVASVAISEHVVGEAKVGEIGFIGHAIQYGTAVAFRFDVPLEGWFAWWLV